MSQLLAAGRHTAVRLASAGQAALVPVHFSAMSHTPAAGRHGVVEARKELAGHEADEPVQVSAASQTPAEGRHGVPAATKQLSAASLHTFAHTPPPRQGLPAWAQPPFEQVSTPLQNCPSSHVAVLFGCVHVPVPLQTSLVHTLASLPHGLPTASN